MNFIIYLLTSPRIRQAYSRFLSDMIWSRGRVERFKSNVKSETFWAVSMENGAGNHALTSHNTLETPINQTEVDDLTRHTVRCHWARCS